MKNQTSKPLYFALAAVFAALFAHAATLYWDGATPAGAPGGGAGTWETSTTNWDTSLAGGDIAWVNANKDTAFFGGTAGTVTLASNIDVGGLTFNTTGYGITTTGNSLSFAGTNNTILFNNIAAATITGPVGGSGNLMLTAFNANTAGTLTLNGTSTGGWSGATTVNTGMTLSLAADNQGLNNTSGLTLNGGNITLTNTSGTAITNNRVSNSTITSNGGTFTYANTSGTGVYAETIGTVALTSGQMNFNLATNQTGAGSQTLTLSALTQSGSGAVTFSANTTAPNATKNMLLVSGASATPAGQIIGPWATTGTAANNQNDYAVYDASGYIVPANIAASAETTWTTAANAYTLSTPAKTATALTATRNIAALKASSTATITSSATTAGSPTFTVASGHSFNVGDPVVLSSLSGDIGSQTLPYPQLTVGTVYYVAGVTGTTFTLAATPGGTAINAGQARTAQFTGGLKLDSGINLGTTGILNSGNAPLAIGRSATGGEVTLPSAGAGNLYVTTGLNPVTSSNSGLNGRISIDAPIMDNGGALTLVKNGAGVLRLQGASNYSGGTVINSGTVIFTDGSSGANFGTGDITFNGSGALSFGPNYSFAFAAGGTVNLSRPITVNSGAIAGFYYNTPNTTMNTSAAITGDGGIISGKDPVVTYGGGDGTININFSSTGNTFTGPLTISNATATFNSLADSSSPMILSSNFTYGSGATASLSVPSRLVDVRGNVTITNSAGSSRTVTLGDISTSTSGAKTLTFSNTNTNGAGFIIGDITNGAGTISVTKSGTGSLTISGNMSHTGGITHSGGTLTLSGTNTYSGNTNFNAAGTSLTFAGLQAVSPNTTFVMNTNNSTSDSTARLLDDTGGVNGSTASVPNTFTIQNNNAPGNAHTFFVGNNNTANGGTSSGTTTGSTIAFGTLNWNTYASGTTAYGPIQIQGTNGYRLQIDSVVLHNAANLTSGTVGQTTFSPTTANVTLGTVTVGTGNTGQGYQTFVMDGTSSDNRVTGAISNASDFGTSNRELRVTKSNTSTWTLSGGNTYTGTTTVNGGTLAGVGANAFGSTSEIRIAAAGTLSLRGDSSTSFVKASDSSAYSVTTTASGATLNVDQATIAGTGAKTMTIGTLGTTSTAATFQVNFTGANNTSLSLGAATGPASTAVATVTFSNGISSPGSLTLASYTSANTSGGETVIFTGTGNTTVSGAITPSSTTLALTKNGAGTTTLAGNNVYTGVTTVNAGVLRLNSANALPGGIASSGGTSALTLSGGGVIGLGNGDFERGTGTGVTQVQWSGSGGFAAYGANRAVDLGGSGATVTWNAGNFVTTGNTLVFGAADATHTLDFQNPINLGGGARTVQVNDGAAVIDATLSGLLSGSGGGLTKTGAGTLQLSQATTYTGATSVSAGTLLLDGASAAVTSSSGVALSGGTLLLSNTSALNNTDRLNDSGTVNLSGGTLNFSHTGGAASYSETTGALTVTGTGSQIITSRAASGQTSTLTFASLSLGGNLQFTGDALGLNDRNRIFITAQSDGPIGLLSTYFDPLNNVTTQANYTLANGVGPLSADANVDVLGGTIPDGSAAVSIIQAGTSGNISISSPITTINSLTQTASQAGTVAMAGGILRTDLVIIGNPNAPLTIGATPGEGTLTPKTAGGAMNFNNNYAAPLLTINSVIADNGGASSLIKTGAGTLRIAAGATYTGSTGIGAGTVTLTGAGALPDTSPVDLSDASSVLHLSGISASAETIGSLTGVSGSSVVLGSKTLALNGVSPAPFAGVISGSGGGLTLLSGATQELTGDNTFTGNVTIGANASLSVDKIQTSGAQPLGQGTTPIVMQGSIGTGSTLTYTGAGVGATNRGLSLTGGQGGTVNVTAGTLTVNGPLSGSANFHKAGAGTLIMSGGSSWNADGFVNAGTLVLGGDSSPGSNSLSAGNWTVATGATMRLNTTGALETSTLTRNGTFNLEAGTLRTNTIAGSGAFVWGAGTIAPLSNLTEGSTDRTDPGGSPSGPVVREGTILDYSGNLATSNGSTLDLGGLFTDNGLRYNQINVSGSLSLAATDELRININPYLLRPNTYTSIFTGDWGTLRLAMADSISGTFDTVTGIGTDFIGFAADPGSGGTDSFINPASLAMNTYYIEYRTSGVLSGAAVLFHYKVAGSVPEPGSAGLLLGGALLLRAIRRRGNAPSAPLRLRLSRTRRRMNRRRRFAG